MMENPVQKSYVIWQTRAKKAENTEVSGFVVSFGKKKENEEWKIGVTNEACY